MHLRTIIAVVLVTLSLGARAASGQALNLTAPAAPAAAAAGAGLLQNQTPRVDATSHRIGAGVALGGSAFGIGGSLRFWPGGDPGPLGFQADISFEDYVSASRTVIGALVLYKLNPFAMNAPMRMQPYVGGGLVFSRFSFDNDFAFVDASDNDLGIQARGGVQIFFEAVPKLGVSGDLGFSQGGDDFVNYGGLAFTALAHWYFR